MQRARIATGSALGAATSLTLATMLVLMLKLPEVTRSMINAYLRADPYRRVGRAYDPQRPRGRKRYDGTIMLGGRFYT